MGGGPSKTLKAQAETLLARIFRVVGYELLFARWIRHVEPILRQRRSQSPKAFHTWLAHSTRAAKRKKDLEQKRLKKIHGRCRHTLQTFLRLQAFGISA